MTETTITCPLCGAKTMAPLTCKDAYHELSLYSFSHPNPAFIHQYVVDAYGAQHLTEHSKPIAIAATLIGLYLFVERNYSGKHVQNVHVALGNNMKRWPAYVPPIGKSTLTVVDVLAAPAGPERDHVIKQWARAVWDTWKKETPIIEALLKAYE